MINKPAISFLIFYRYFKSYLSVIKRNLHAFSLPTKRSISETVFAGNIKLPVSDVPILITKRIKLNDDRLLQLKLNFHQKY